MPEDAEMGREDERVMPEDSDQRLRREFAKYAMGGMMPWAMQHQKSETEIADFAWRVADRMIELEHEEYQEPAPVAPPPRTAARPGQVRVANPNRRQPR